MEPFSEHEKANARLWSKRAGTNDAKAFGFFRVIQRKLLDTLELRPGMALLDVGCGTGWAVIEASDRLKGEGRFIGVDISEGMIEKAAQFSFGRRGVGFHQASSESLPLESNDVDLVISTLSFHHYAHPGKALGEMFRVLKPGGKAYILDMTADDFFIRAIDRMSGAVEKEHVRFYSSNEYHDLFPGAGLKPVQSVKIVCYPLKVHVAEKPIVG